MTRDDLDELHFVTAISNAPSTLERGILCHNAAARIEHESLAMREIQDRRREIVVPQGRRLHEYANLYINARNKMLFRVIMRVGIERLAILRISPDVLDVPGVVVTDENAASGYVLFSSVAQGLPRLVRDIVFAESWKHPEDQVREWQHGSAMCAEVLVPNRIGPNFILGGWTGTETARDALRAVASTLDVRINSRLFFR